MNKKKLLNDFFSSSFSGFTICYDFNTPCDLAVQRHLWYYGKELQSLYDKWKQIYAYFVTDTRKWWRKKYDEHTTTTTEKKIIAPLKLRWKVFFSSSFTVSESSFLTVVLMKTVWHWTYTLWMRKNLTS